MPPRRMPEIRRCAGTLSAEDMRPGARRFSCAAARSARVIGLSITPDRDILKEIIDGVKASGKAVNVLLMKK